MLEVSKSDFIHSNRSRGCVNSSVDYLNYGERVGRGGEVEEEVQRVKKRRGIRRGGEGE